MPIEWKPYGCARMAKKLADSEVLSIVSAEIDAASGFTSGELADQRGDAMDYYLGEPYGDEVEGRSQYRSREVMETIQNLIPSLMRVFGEAENLVTFDAVGPEDVDVAKQESDRVSYCYWKENRGFYNTLTFVQDALLSKTGVLVAEVEEGKEAREEYEALTPLEFQQLMEDQSVIREPVSGDLNEDGTANVIFRTKERDRVSIEPVPPEELGVNRDARSPYAQDAQFLYLRRRKSFSDLVEEGFDPKVLRSIPSNDDVETEERLARRNLDDEQDVLRHGYHESLRTFWITTCYIRLDRNGDDIAELLKVVVAAGAGESASGARLLSVEEVDAIPVFTAPPSILTHKFNGLSIADCVMDIQRIVSTLTRQMLDNTYLTNNARVHVNENVNKSDMLTKRPGGVVRHKGDTQPAANMAPEPVTPLASDTYGLLEHFDTVIKQRTGATDDVGGLDVGALSNLNTGVAAMAMERARMKLDLIARILAEIGFKPLFKHVHSLLQKTQDKAEVIELRGKWVEVNPSEWRDRKNLTVQVGQGVPSRERKLMMMQDAWEKQQAIVQGGGLNVIVHPMNIYNLMNDYVEAAGLDSERYFMNPEMAPPPEPPPPDPQIQVAQMMAQVEMAKAQNDAEKNKIELMKAQRDGQISVMELQQKGREVELEKQIEAIRLDRERLKGEHDAAIGRAKLMIEDEIKTRDRELKAAMAKLDDERKESGQQIDLYKAMLQHSATMDRNVLSQVGVNVPERPAQKADDTAAQMQELREMNAQLMQRLNAPKEVKRDASGRAIALGDLPITRDENGLIRSIG